MSDCILQLRSFLPSVCVIGLLLILCLRGHAEQLPVKNYTTADGLPRDSATHVEQDSRGFIWVIAGDGISRFDGYKFINYTTDDGLPDRRVNDLLETRNGDYWLATARGLVHLNPRGVRQDSSEPMFVAYNPGEKPINFNILLEDERGVIWCGTSEGLYQLEVSPDSEAHFRFIDLRMPPSADKNINAVLKDRCGNLWVAASTGLYRLLPDGRAEFYSIEHGLPKEQSLTSLLEDLDGNIWVGTTGGLCRLVRDPDPSSAVVAQTYSKKDGLAGPWVMALHQARNGNLWVATNAGLSLYTAATNSQELNFRAYNGKNGVCDYDIFGVTEDRDGNLWIASRCSVTKIMRNGFTGYGLADGFESLLTNSIFEERDGTLVVTNSADPLGAKGPASRRINVFDGERFTPIRANIPTSIDYYGWGWGQSVLQDHLGDWWVPTGHGLYRFQNIKRAEDLAHATPQFIWMAGLDSDDTEIFRLYEDSRGDVWIATTGVRNALLRWERATNSIKDLTAQTRRPPKTDFTFFTEDRAGNLWVGTSDDAGLLRYSNGDFRNFTIADGAPPGWISWLYSDHLGRLWVASTLGGLLRVDDPASDTLHVIKYTTADRLSSNSVRAITEDRWGRIYACTGHGVDRLDPETKVVKHFTSADGLPKGTIESAYQDKQGRLWFGSSFGVACLVPEEHESQTLPSAYITGLRIAGIPQRVSELGETNLPQLALTSNQNQLSIDYLGLGGSVGEEILYQYRLEGAENDWSRPTTERTISYANLAPGTYRFMVRAFNATGQANQKPTAFSFRIAAPIWMRGWFWALTALALGLIIFALYRYRVAQLLRVANMRTRIATDLHDDIGANLTRISILSEVARRQLGNAEDDDGPLSSIARISRESVASMRDIVWAISPQQDHLVDLVRKMRRHAEEVFTLRDIDLRFSAPRADQNLKLDVNVRRDMLLIFKEAVNNVTRHSGCTRVEIELRVEDEHLVLKVADNGMGFNGSVGGEGQGLMSMRRRALGLEGTLEIESGEKEGVVVKLKIPLARSRLFPN